MVGIGMIISFALLLSFTSSARIGLKSHTGIASRVGPDGEDWVKDKYYVCMQKYEQSKDKFVDSFCLANYRTALSSATEHLKFSTDLASCESSKEIYKLKVCALKGEAPDKRLSYSTKKHVSKACFRHANIEGSYPVLQATVDEEGCEAAMRKPTEAQYILPRPTITTSTTTIMEEQLSPVRSIGSESELETGDHDEIIEAKALFVAGEDLLWEYKEKAFKCCVSSAGLPLKIQDMNAAELPAVRTFGTSRGCGMMFGDTYHNGLKSHKDSEPGCPMPSSRLREITGEDFDETKSSLQVLD